MTYCERSLGTKETIRLSPRFEIYAQCPCTNQEALRYGVRFVTNTLQNIEVFGKPRQLTEYVEGKAWIETQEGYRLASNYIQYNPRCHSLV